MCVFITDVLTIIAIKGLRTIWCTYNPYPDKHENSQNVFQEQIKIFHILIFVVRIPIFNTFQFPVVDIVLLYYDSVPFNYTPFMLPLHVQG